MRDFAKRKIDGDFPEEQSWPNRPIAVSPSPISQRNPGKLTLGAGSSFQLWRKPSWMDLGDGIAEASNSAAKPYLQLAIPSSNSAPAQDHNNKNNAGNSTPGSAQNPINVGGATSGAANDDNEPQAGQPGSACNSQPEMDPKKLKRIMANRVSAQKSRLKQNEYVADLERKAKSYQNKISRLHPEIAAHKSQQRLLLIEQHKLKLQMAAREKERVLQEVEIEKNRAEVSRLSELQRKQVAEAQARMLNLGAAMQLMISNSNLNPSGLGRVVCTNSDQAQNGVQIDAAQLPQNQSQMWMAKWNNRQISSSNHLNLLKSEPES